MYVAVGMVSAEPPTAAVNVATGCAVATSAVDAVVCVLCGPISRCMALLALISCDGDSCGGGGILTASSGIRLYTNRRRHEQVAVSTR